MYRDICLLLCTLHHGILGFLQDKYTFLYTRMRRLVQGVCKWRCTYSHSNLQTPCLPRTLQWVGVLVFFYLNTKNINLFSEAIVKTFRILRFPRKCNQEMGCLKPVTFPDTLCRSEANLYSKLIHQLINKKTKTVTYQVLVFLDTSPLRYKPRYGAK